jgi:hypothetical protein
MEFRDLYGYSVSKCGVVIGKRGRARKPSDNGRGYLILTLQVGGKSVTKAVHRLVAEAWVANPDPYNLVEVNHIDCNRYNNNADNLEWVTHGYNIEYSYTTKGRSATGENNVRCTITEVEVRQICGLLQDGLSAAQVRDAGFDYARVRAIKRRTNWNHISDGYSW